MDFFVSIRGAGELASSKWRLRFGRRDTAMALGEVDPTGSYCAMPDDWLQKKLGKILIVIPMTHKSKFNIFRFDFSRSYGATFKEDAYER